MLRVAEWNWSLTAIVGGGFAIVAQVVPIGLAMAGSVGCSQGPEDEASQPVAQQCRDFVAAYCAKMTECALPSDRSRASEDCDFDFEVNLSCDSVREVRGSMKTCLDAISAIDCASINPPGSWPTTPMSCRLLVTE